MTLIFITSVDGTLSLFKTEIFTPIGDRNGLKGPTAGRFNHRRRGACVLI